MTRDDIQSPATAGGPTQPQQIIIQQPPRRFGFLKWLLGTIVVVAVFFLLQAYGNYQDYYTPANMPREKYHSLDKYATKKIAIIDISGPILSAEDGFVKRQIDQVRGDPDVVAVVARINTPGGTVTGSDYIYHHLRALVEQRKLPLVVSMGDICASGGYYAAMAVGKQPDAIFAEPTTWTGSIGVIIPHFDFSGALGSFRIKDDSVVSGPFKEMGSPTRQMTEEERKLLQTLVDRSFDRFKEIVIGGRPGFKDKPTALAEVTTGQVFTAGQALEHGLVDRIGFLEDAIARAAELAQVTPEDVRCVKYEEKPTVFGELIGVHAPGPARGQFDLTALLDLITPRAYYLWTWVPAVLSSGR